MANNDFHLWCPSAILNLQNFDFFYEMSILEMEIRIRVTNLIEIR